MSDNPYRVVVDALAAQTVAIGQLAKEIKVEFAQYQNAVASKDTARANRIAAAINARTAKLTEAADALAASVPDAAIDNELPTPPPGVDNSLPGNQPGVDNELPDRERPVDPGFGRPEKPGGGIDNELPDVGRPVDPDFGVDEERPPRPGNRPPGSGNRPDQGLPEDQPIVGGGPIDRPGTPGSPPERPNPADVPELEYLAPSSAKAGEEVIFSVSGSGFVEPATAYIDGEEAPETPFVNANQVRVKKTFGSAGTYQITVDGSDPLPFTVN